MTQQLLTKSPEKTQQHVKRRETSPASAQSFQGGLHPIAQLQRMLGNRRVAQLIQAKQLTPEGKILGLQRKLTVGAADDQYEQEADRVARQVMSMPNTSRGNTESLFTRAHPPESPSTPPATTPRHWEPPSSLARAQAGEEEQRIQKADQDDRPQRAERGRGDDARRGTPVSDKSFACASAKATAAETSSAPPSPPRAAGMPRYLHRAALTVDTPHSPLEREAEEEAARIVGAPAPTSDAAPSARRAPAISRAGESGTGMAPLAGPAVANALGTGGEPLPATERAFFEPRLGTDLSAVRIHDDAAAHAAAREIRARAFTHRQDIHFGAGSYRPQETGGRRLLAHELVHTAQREVPGLLQAEVDIEADFEQRRTVPVENAPTRPVGTIRYQTADGRAVYAPYGIYRVQEIPSSLHGIRMESREALRLLYPDMTTVEIYQQYGAGAAAANTAMVSIGQMVRYAEQIPGVNLRVLIANIEGAYRFLGYDVSHAEGGRVHSGFVESELGPGPTPRTAGVGAALFADRVTRALAEGVGAMDLRVGSSERTEGFHARIWRIIGRSGTPVEGMPYRLDIREMARIALAWSDVLTAGERQELVRFATQEQAPAPAAVRAALARTAVGAAEARAPGLAAGPFAATPGGTMEMMRRFMNELRSNVRQPAEIERLRQLQEPETQQRVMRDHAGFALAEGRLYRLEAVGGGARISEVIPEPIVEPLPEPLGPAITSGGLAPGPRILNFDPTRALRIGETVIPPSAFGLAELQVGELLVVGGERVLEAVDPATGRPLLGIYEGGRWYRVVGEDMRNLEFDPETGMRITTLKTEGAPVRAVELETDLPAPGTFRHGPIARATAGGVSIIMVANEILGPMGAALQAQRARISQGKAEFELWSRLGANPVPRVWDKWGQRMAPEGAVPSTSVHGASYLPFILDIDAERLRAELPRRIQSYVELRLVIESLGAIGALQWTNGRTVAVVNRMAPGGHRFYDITEAMRTVEALTLASSEAAMRERLARRPVAERQGRILRVKPGAELLRSKGKGLFNRQPLLGAEKLLGPNAWVREIRRSSDMVFVEPVNADAHRAVALAAYVINQKIKDVWEECKDHGREVHPAELPSFGEGPLRSFQAGPETTGDQRFGWTRYEIKPDNQAWTVAYGELRAFWISEDDVSAVTDDEIKTYLAG